MKPGRNPYADVHGFEKPAGPDRPEKLSRLQRTPEGPISSPNYVLSIDHVQGDPYAAPPPGSASGQRPGGFSSAPAHGTSQQRIALQDQLLRRFGRLAGRSPHQAKGSGHSGLVSVSRCGQEVLDRTACQLDPRSGDILLRLEIGFPANGRTINARGWSKSCSSCCPSAWRGPVLPESGPAKLEAAQLAEDQQYIRQQLPRLGLCAFVADGSVLPGPPGCPPAHGERRPLPGPGSAGGDSGAAPGASSPAWAFPRVSP